MPRDRGAKLSARPSSTAGEGPTGLRPLGLADERDGLLYVPSTYRPEHPAPLVLMLHGAGGEAGQGVDPLRPLADARGMILLAPESRRGTWDAIRGAHDRDAAFVDRALIQLFDRYAVDPSRIAIAGFSDGASYALSLGLANGALFTHVIAFSPGFVPAAPRRGRPRLFVAHGTGDRVLPIDLCSRRIVPQLERAGYDVHYREFDGPHVVPPAVALEALEWFETTRPAPTTSQDS